MDNSHLIEESFQSPIAFKPRALRSGQAQRLCRNIHNSL
jgi:hypothetical protein